MTEKTSLYDFHQSHQGKLVEFADTWLPVQYPTGILKEHQAVREQAGLFDVSHMGEFLVEGGRFSRSFADQQDCQSETWTDALQLPVL